MTDPKHSNIMMAMVTLTLNTMDSGKSHNLLLRLLQSLLHKTQNTLTSFHLSTSPDGEESTTDPKHSNITMEMVTLTHNMTDHGKFHNPLLKLLQLLLHKTQSIPMNYHLSTSLDGEENMIDHRLSSTMMVLDT